MGLGKSYTGYNIMIAIFSFFHYPSSMYEICMLKTTQVVVSESQCWKTNQIPIGHLPSGRILKR